MNVEAEIRGELSRGTTPKDLITHGYKRSTVYKMAHIMKLEKQRLPLTDAELLQSSLKKLTPEELRVVFEIGALLHDPAARPLLKRLVE